LLPAAGFIQHRIKTPVRVRCPVPVETRFSKRPFALRQRRSTFRRTSAAGSTFLACIFETIPKFSLARSVLNSRPRLAFLWPLRGTIDALNPLPGPIPELHACAQTSAPRRDFSIPSARSAQPDPNREGLPLRVARSSFAPRRARIITYHFARRIIVPEPPATAPSRHSPSTGSSQAPPSSTSRSMPADQNR